jgi:hypothetical protein
MPDAVDDVPHLADLYTSLDQAFSAATMSETTRCMPR